LEEVKVQNSPEQPLLSENAQMSVNKISVVQMQEVPALLGEKDMLKVLQLLPGVNKGSEGNSGLYVRGGGADQNLIIVDDAPVYNAFHLFGFFSLFNGDALKSIELTKGGFPARFGGKLSSVIEMQMKEGSKEKLHGDVSLGLLSARATLLPNPLINWT
jgi:outer membrane receptor protein involved in Fe transport